VNLVEGVSPTLHVQRNNITARLFPGLPVLTSIPSTGFEAMDIVAVDPSWASWRLHVNYVSGIAAVGSGYSIFGWTFDATKTVLAQRFSAHADQFLAQDDDPNTGTVLVNHATERYVGFTSSHQSATTVDGVVDVSIDFTCTGDPGPTPCCPPDPAVTALLEHLVQLVTQQQRWRLPFATVPAASHSVSGVGSFAVSRVVGLTITVTAGIPSSRQSFGNPTYQFDLGWMSVMDDEGMLQELRVTRATQQWFPAHMQLATLVGYAFQAGVSATITELVIEP